MARLHSDPIDCVVQEPIYGWFKSSSPFCILLEPDSVGSQILILQESRIESYTFEFRHLHVRIPCGPCGQVYNTVRSYTSLYIAWDSLKELHVCTV